MNLQCIVFVPLYVNDPNEDKNLARVSRYTSFWQLHSALDSYSYLKWML